jgi:hypothetical protein
MSFASKLDVRRRDVLARAVLCTKLNLVSNLETDAEEALGYLGHRLCDSDDSGTKLNWLAQLALELAAEEHFVGRSKLGGCDRGFCIEDLVGARKVGGCNCDFGFDQTGRCSARKLTLCSAPSGETEYRQC